MGDLYLELSPVGQASHGISSLAQADLQTLLAFTRPPRKVCVKQERADHITAEEFQELLGNCFQMAIDSCAPPGCKEAVGLSSMEDSQVSQLANHSAVRSSSHLIWSCHPPARHCIAVLCTMHYSNLQLQMYKCLSKPHSQLCVWFAVVLLVNAEQAGPSVALCGTHNCPLASLQARQCVNDW